MIFFITYYFPPELSAGAFRSKDLVRSLETNFKQNPDKIIILTAKEYRHHQDINYDNLKNTNTK